MKDYYNILDVSPVASLEKIKEQYHFLLFAWHPDRYPDDQKAKSSAIPKRGRLTIHDDKLNKQKYSATNGNEQKKSNSERNDASKKRQRLHSAVPEKSNNKENKQKPSAANGKRHSSRKLAE